MSGVLLVIGGVLAAVIVVGIGMVWTLAGPKKRTCRCGHFIARHRMPDTSCIGDIKTGENAVGVAQYVTCTCPAFRPTERGRFKRALEGAEEAVVGDGTRH